MTPLPDSLLEAVAAAAVREGLADAVFTRLATPIGRLLVVQGERGIVRVGFEDEAEDRLLAEVAAAFGPRIVASDRELTATRDTLDAYFAGEGDPQALPFDLTLVPAPFRHVVLDLEPGVTVSGQVVFRGSVPPPAAAVMARAGLEIRLDAAVLGPLSHWPGPSITRPDATGRFVLHDVFPGTYRISASQREASGWFFDTTTIPGADVTGQLVEVKRQDLTGIAVTLTDRRTELSGTIMTDKGEPAPEYFILLYPSDEKYWTPYSGRLYGTRAKQDGTFVIGGFHAGSYRLATLLDAEFGAWFDPAFLRRIDTASMAVSIADDKRKVLNLRVPGDR